MIRSLGFLMLSLVGFCLAPAIGSSQQDTIPAPQPASQPGSTPTAPVATAPPAKKSSVHLHRAAQPAGARVYSPGKWGMVFVEVVNPTEQPIDVLAVMHFEAAPNAKFGRRLWAPPLSRRAAWAPVRTPAMLEEGDDLLEINTALVDASKANADVLTVGTGEVFYSSLVSLARESATALISDTSVVEGAERDFAHESIEAIRLSAGMSRSLHLVQDSFFPPIPEAYDGVDNLVISSDLIGEDSAGLAAVRRWLYDGGRLWLMLDRVSPETAQALLGDDFLCEVVDRVGITTLRMGALGEQPADVTDALKETRDFEEPVDLVRVVGDDLDVRYTVDGWPAAFWLKAGRGSVLVTTLGARGWIRPRVAGDPTSTNAFKTSDFIAMPMLKELGSYYFAPEVPMPLVAADFEEALQEEIGYRIPSRVAVIGVLSLFCTGLLVGGVLLGRKGRREHLGWAAPLGALVTGGILAYLGLQTRQAVSTQVASGQFVEAAPGVEDVLVTGLMGFYNRSPSNYPIGAERGGVFDLDMEGLDGAPLRITWDEVDKWSYDNITLPAGVRPAAIRYAGRLASPLAARATFGPEGLSGAANLKSLEAPGDAVVAMASNTPALGVELESEGRFRSIGSLAEGKYITGNVLNDRQRRRQEIYRKLFAPSETRYPQRPTLFVWSKPLDLQFGVEPEAELSGDALVSIPLEFDRTAPGTKVSIPAACLPFRPVIGPEGESISSVYSTRNDEWLELSAPAKCWLRFQAPTSVLPLTVERATLRVNMRAPSRTVELRAAQPNDDGVGGSAAFGEKSNPSAEEQLTMTIDDPSLLKLDDQGGLSIGLFVSDLERDPADTSGLQPEFKWQVESISLEMTGMTAE